MRRLEVSATSIPACSRIRTQPRSSAVAGGFFSPSLRILSKRSMACASCSVVNALSGGRRQRTRFRRAASCLERGCRKRRSAAGTRQAGLSPNCSSARGSDDTPAEETKVLPVSFTLKAISWISFNTSLGKSRGALSISSIRTTLRAARARAGSQADARRPASGEATAGWRALTPHS